MSTPGKEHWTTIKRVFKYLCGMMDFAINYGREPEDNKEINVHGFFDFDWAGDIEC